MIITMNTIKKLKWYKEKIQEATAWNKDLGEFIGIELFDFINENKSTKDEFNKRVHYFNNLVNNKEIASLQDKLFNAIQAILKLTNIKEVSELQKEWNKACSLPEGKNQRLLNNLNIRDKNFLTLHEYHQALQDNNNYYRLSAKKYHAPIFADEISYFCRTVAIRRQYEGVENFFSKVQFSLFGENAELSEKYKILGEEYNKIWYQFDEKLYKTPKKRHTKQFEEFFLLCVKVYPIRGYEWDNQFFKDGLYKDENGKELANVKDFCSVVLDDLLEHLQKDGFKSFHKPKPRIQTESERIKSIIIVKPPYNEEKQRYVINEDYENIKSFPRSGTKSWKNLTEAIENHERIVYFRNATLNYFNYTKECPIYCGGKYKLTKIFKKLDRFEKVDGRSSSIMRLQIDSEITTEVIEDSTFQKRLNKGKT